MKPQIQLIIGILGLSAFVSLPAVAQTNQLDNFFTGTPPYNGDRLNRPLNPVEETQDSAYREIQESAPTTPTTIDNRSQAVPRSSNQAEFLQDSGYTEIQPPTVTTPMTRENLVNPNRNSAY